MLPKKVLTKPIVPFSYALFISTFCRNFEQLGFITTKSKWEFCLPLPGEFSLPFPRVRGASMVQGAQRVHRPCFSYFSI